MKIFQLYFIAITRSTHELDSRTDTGPAARSTAASSPFEIAAHEPTIKHFESIPHTISFSCLPKILQTVVNRVLSV